MSNGMVISGSLAGARRKRQRRDAALRRALLIGLYGLSALLLYIVDVDSPSMAAVLNEPAGVEAQAGEHVIVVLPIDHTSGPRIEIRLGVAPNGVSLELDDSGQLQLEWQTGPDMPEESRIELLVRDVDSGEDLDSVFAVIRRYEPGPGPGPGPDQGPASGERFSPEFESGPASGSGPGFGPESGPEPNTDPSGGSSGPAESGPVFIPRSESGTGSRPDTQSSPPTQTPSGSEADAASAPEPDFGSATGQTSGPDSGSDPESNTVRLPVSGSEPGDLSAPRLLSLPNQVVSAGRTVRFRVKADMQDDDTPILMVDRLPRRASFEANVDGSRTFRWQTDNKDQGEHLFRFSALHPRAPQLRSYREVLIIVGDPSYNITRPGPVR